MHVRRKARTGNDLLHMLPGRGADTGAVIEDEGDGGRADTGDLCDVTDRQIGHKTHQHSGYYTNFSE